jgi:EAL domain-containing protein (putative c-di-GMP-specific phosphodiesterase class I)/GGDEF domain-containing protein
MHAADHQGTPLPPKSVLERLIAEKLVATAFQPIVSLESGEIAGFESLARPAKESGIPNPSILFDMAERDDLTWQVEEITRSNALTSAEDFPNGILLFTNSTPDVFTDPRFIEDVNRLVKSVPGLTPSRIVLEITERSGGDDLTLVAQQVEKLKQMGFQIAIDDVGAGTSGLTRIMMLRPHWLKLDRELVAGIDQNRYKLNLLRFMIHFARLSGVHVIAEGIERQEELAALISLGVRYGQGYYLGRPAFGYQTIKPEIAEWISMRWREAEETRGDDPRRVTIGQLCQPVDTAQMSTQLKELALRMLKQGESLGAAVLDGKRLMGWCSRDAILAAARRSDAHLPVGFISSSDLGTLPPTATIGEAIELLTSREDRYLADPVIVAEQDEIVGVVTLRRLLSATVGETRLWAGLSANLTGLPGRIAADRRMRQLIKDRSQTTTAAVVDIRGFSDYNGAYGYDMGDRLIQDLGAFLRSHVATSDPEAFIAHLGDDHFLITSASQDFVERLHNLMHAFESAVTATPAWALMSASQSSCVENADQPFCQDVLHRLGLRVLVMPGVFARISTPRQLLDLQQTMRSTLRAMEDDQSADTSTRSMLLIEGEQTIRSTKAA